MYFVCLFILAGLCDFAFGTSLFSAEQLRLDAVWRILFAHSACISVYIGASFGAMVNGVRMDCAGHHIAIIWHISRHLWHWSGKHVVSNGAHMENCPHLIDHQFIIGEVWFESGVWFQLKAIDIKLCDKLNRKNAFVSIIRGYNVAIASTNQWTTLKQKLLTLSLSPNLLAQKVKFIRQNYSNFAYTTFSAWFAFLHVWNVEPRRKI